MPLNFLSAVLEVTRSMLGWTVVVFVTQVIGFWLGMYLGYGVSCGFQTALLSFPMCCVGWILFPQLLIPLGVTVLCWYIPIQFEGRGCKAYAASANLLVWVIVIAWGIWPG
jgi:hypothetical protein